MYHDVSIFSTIIIVMVSTYLSACLSICLSVRPSVCLSTVPREKTTKTTFNNNKRTKKLTLFLTCCLCLILVLTLSQHHIASNTSTPFDTYFTFEQYCSRRSRRFAELLLSRSSGSVGPIPNSNRF